MTHSSESQQRLVKPTAWNPRSSAVHTTSKVPVPQGAGHRSWKSTLPSHSCQANHLIASKTAHKGELCFQVLAGKSSKEQAIIYLITLTIPLWKSICFLLWIAAQGQPAKESVLCGTFDWTHWIQLLFPLKQEWLMCEKWRGTALYQAQNTFLLRQLWKAQGSCFEQGVGWLSFVCLEELSP